MLVRFAPFRSRLARAALPIALVALLGASPSSAEERGRIAQVERARFAAVRSALPPPADAFAEGVDLPDRWARSHPGVRREGWYRLVLPDAWPDDEPLGLLAPHVNTNLEVWLNGSWVGDGGSLRAPIARGFNRPHYFALPRGLLRGDGRDVVDVRLVAWDPAYAELGAVRIGPDALLRVEYARGLLWRTELSRWCTALAAFSALVLTGLFVGTRGRPEYGWLALAIGLWTVASLNYWVSEIPLPDRAWEWLVHAAIAAFAAAMPVWTHAFLGLVRPRTDRAVLAAGALAAIVLALTPHAAFHLVSLVVLAASGSVTLYVLGLAYAYRERLSGVERTICLVGASAATLLAAHDLAIQAGLLSQGRPRLIVLVVTFVLASFGASELARFLRAFKRAEDRNVELERDRAVSRERERIMREVHDGIGANLVATLAMVESGEPAREVTRAIRAAIDDMRLVIDSLDPLLTDLNALLAQLRTRLESVLERDEVRVVWQVEELPAVAGMGPEECLSLLRIAQEAVTNALKHAAPRRIRIAAARADGAVVLEIEDDGPGIAADARPGRGLANMRQRARDLGAGLTIESVEAGTRVTVSLPLSRRAGSSPG